jgi:hypothetical protein
VAWVQDKELRAMHMEHQREVAAMQREGARLGEVMRENMQLREELEGVHASLASFKVRGGLVAAQRGGNVGTLAPLGRWMRGWL